MNKKITIPRNLRTTLWILRIRAPIDSRRGSQAVEKTISSVYKLLQSYIHKLCSEFITEHHALLIEVSKTVNEYPHFSEPIDVKETGSDAKEAGSIVKRKAKMAEAAAAAKSARKNADRNATNKSDLSVYIDEHCEVIEFVSAQFSSNIETYLSKASKNINIEEIENPFKEFAFDPVAYHIFSFDRTEAKL